MDKFCRIFQSALRCIAIFVVVGTVAGAAGCSAADETSDLEPVRPEGRFSLTSHDNWSTTDSDTDPFVDRPAQVDCPASSLGPEELNGEQSFAVLTDFCTYVTARQATVEDVYAGDTLNFRIFHFALEADEPSQAHVALRIGDQVLADETLAIPSSSGLIAGEMPAAVDMPAGTLVYFHVHNHGANEYSLVELSGEAP